MTTTPPPPFRLTTPVAAKELPTGPRWVHEIDHGSHRCAVVIWDGTVRLFTRNHREVTQHFHHLAVEFLALVGRNAIIDGEIGAPNEKGVATLDNLHLTVEAGAYERLVYFAFDLLFIDEGNLRPQPLLSRKRCLRDLLKPLQGSQIQYCDHLSGDPIPLYRRLCEVGAEGIVSKIADAPYRGGRDPNWVKVKCPA